jgi:hypothetical protein
MHFKWFESLLKNNNDNSVQLKSRSRYKNLKIFTSVYDVSYLLLHKI